MKKDWNVNVYKNPAGFFFLVATTDSERTLACAIFGSEGECEEFARALYKDEVTKSERDMEETYICHMLASGSRCSAQELIEQEREKERVLREYCWEWYDRGK